MTTLFLRIIALLALFHSIDLDAQSFVVKKNLRSEWMSFDGSAFKPMGDDNNNVNVFYIRLTNPDPRGEYLRISSVKPYSLFVNNQLGGQFNSRILNIDSLARAADTKDLMVAVYFAGQSAGNIRTELLSAGAPVSVAPALEKRRPWFFNDFVIIGSLTLLVMITVMVRVNPKLATDYFSLPRIFSFREMEDAQVYARIASSTNILFYIYCSLLTGFYLLVIFHFVPTVYPVSQSFQAESFGGALADWLRLSGLLLGLLLLKIIIVIGFASLFGMSQVAGIHFFNWVRIIVVFFGLLTLFLVIYFIWYGQDVGVMALMLRLLAWIIAGWIILIFLKLTSKSGASMFHLFSYICATELIPFLFIIRVLYN